MQGLKIVDQQLQLFNKMNKRGSHFAIIDLYDPENNPEGTRCELCIPLS
jgi:hypothetical protein